MDRSPLGSVVWHKSMSRKEDWVGEEEYNGSRELSDIISNKSALSTDRAGSVSRERTG
jgi:hypothetical protein